MTSWIPIGVSVLAIIVSFMSCFFNFHSAQKAVLTTTISNQRIEWIANVRNSINDFLDSYVDLNVEQIELLKKKYKIELYLNSSNMILLC